MTSTAAEFFGTLWRVLGGRAVRRPWLVWLAAWLGLVAPGLAGPVHKCTVNGAVTYQQGPCPSSEPRPPPTLQQLNAQQRQRQAAAASATAAATQPAVGAAPGVAPALPQPGPAERRAPATAAPSAKALYRCDGRTHCSQMSSCDEARYFLAHCPGVKMDGDHDGVPCEMQWCAGDPADDDAGSQRDGGRSRRRH